MSVLSHFSASVAEPPADKSAVCTREQVAPSGPGVVPLWRSGALLFLAAILGIAYWLNPPLNIPPRAGVTLELPDQVGHFHGFKAGFDETELFLMPPDTGLARKNYDDFAGHEVRCSIVLSGAEQRSIHRPEGCLTGQGWTIVGQQDLPIMLNSGHKLVVRNLFLEREAVSENGEHYPIRAFYMYWFVGEKITTPSEFTRVFLSSWDRFVHNRAHRWAYVSAFSVITNSVRSDGLNADQTRTMLTDFIRESVPTYQKSEMPSPGGA